MTVAGTLLLIALSTPPAADRIRLTLDTTEAEAVLAIVAASRDGVAGDDLWARLFATEPYRRLVRREAEMQRPFTDDEFRAFVMSDDLARRAEAIRSTLEEWTTRDLDAAGSPRDP